VLKVDDEKVGEIETVKCFDHRWNWKERKNHKYMHSNSTNHSWNEREYWTRPNKPL